MLFLTCFEVTQYDRKAWPEVDGAAPVALGRAVACSLRGPENPDRRVAEVDVVPGQGGRLADAHPGGDQDLGEWPVGGRTRIEVAGDLGQPKVVALNVRRRQ